MSKNKTYNKRAMRIMLVQLMYRHYLMGFSASKSYQELLDNFQISLTEKDIQAYENIFSALDDIEAIVKKKIMKTWTFERLSNIHKAVLVLGIYEINYLDISKAIVINEYLEIIKNYSIEKDYAYINTVLDSADGFKENKNLE